MSGNRSVESRRRCVRTSANEGQLQMRGKGRRALFIRSAIRTRSWQAIDDAQLLTTSAPRCSR